MKTKKILYIKAQGLGDIISGIPFLVEMQQQGHQVTQIFYDMNTLLYLYDVRKLFSRTYRKAVFQFKKTPSAKGWLRVLELYKKQGLLHDILYIPYNVLLIFRVVLKHIRAYDEAVVTIGTRPAKILANIMAKNVRIIFSDTNDISKRKNLSEGELGKTALGSLYSYKENIQFPLEEYDDPRIIRGKYIIFFPSLFERSPEINVWAKIIDYCLSKNLQPVIIGSNREGRFLDSLEQIAYEKKVISLLDKTNFAQMHRLLTHSKANICGNGGVMWLANLVNLHNINIHTVSAFLMEPPVDSKNSYNIRPYNYPACKPCEAGSAPCNYRIPQCIFFDTKQEGACRKLEMKRQVMCLLKKILLP